MNINILGENQAWGMKKHSGNFYNEYSDLLYGMG